MSEQVVQQPVRPDHDDVPVGHVDLHLDGAVGAVAHGGVAELVGAVEAPLLRRRAVEEPEVAEEHEAAVAHVGGAEDAAAVGEDAGGGRPGEPRGREGLAEDALRVDSGGEARGGVLAQDGDGGVEHELAGVLAGVDAVAGPAADAVRNSDGLLVGADEVRVLAEGLALVVLGKVDRGAEHLQCFAIARVWWVFFESWFLHGRCLFVCLFE